MSEKIFYAAAGMGRKVQAQALVASDGFSARYDLDRVRGVFSRPEHKLAGENYNGRVLVLDAAKGGVATAWMLYEMNARGIMPAALVLNRVNPIMVQGAALAKFTMIFWLRSRHHQKDQEWRGSGSRSGRESSIHPRVVNCLAGKCLALCRGAIQSIK